MTGTSYWRRHHPFIRLGQTGVNLYARIYHHLEIVSPPHFPARGPAIVVCNHTSGLDPIMIQSLSRRLIIWLMAREYYDLPLLKPIYQLIEAIPIRRGGNDLAATRKSLRALQSGHMLGIFPEGKIETTREIMPFADGVGMLAVRSGAPVLTAYIDGTQRGQEMGPAFARRQNAVVTFGEPKIYSGKGSQADQKASRDIEENVRKLKERVDAQGSLRDIRTFEGADFL